MPRQSIGEVFYCFLKELVCYLARIQPLGFADGCVDHLDELQAVAIDQAGTGMGLLRSCQRHQQLVSHRVQLDGAPCLERPWLQGSPLCHLSRVADQHQFVIAPLLLPAPEHSPDSFAAVVAGHPQYRLITEVQLLRCLPWNHQLD